MATVSVTAAACSCAPAACCVVLARISSLADVSWPTASRMLTNNFSMRARRCCSVSIVPRRFAVIALNDSPNAANSSLPATLALLVNSPPAIRSAVPVNA